MAVGRPLPPDPLEFLKRSLHEGRAFWTYHVNMRFGRRPITRDAILGAVDSFEVIEAYPDDKYLPSYLVRGEHEGRVLHVVLAADVEGDNCRVVTAYLPDPGKWEADFRKRRRNQ